MHSHVYRLRAAALMFMMVLFVWAFPVKAASLAAADQVGGYADQVLDKVSKLWQPPVETVDRKVRVKVSIDGDGRVLRCAPVASSASMAMDKAACAAVREAEKFAVPPYGLPIDVYLAFWTGLPVRQTLEADKDDKDDKAEKTVQNPAPAAKPLPVVEPPSVAEPSPKTAQTAQATKAAKAAKATKADAVQSQDARYVNSVMAKISPKIVFPKNVASGKYRVIIVLRVAGSGAISQVKLARSSGKAEMDNAVMRAATKTAKVPPPPGKGTKDLKLTFVIQKP